MNVQDLKLTLAKNAKFAKSTQELKEEGRRKKEEGRRKKEEGKIIVIVIVIVILIENKTWMYRMNRI